MIPRLDTLLSTSARRHGDKIALVLGEASMSYRELDRRASRLASGLVRQGLGPGDRVALYGSNAMEWVIAYHGVLRLGGVVVPLNAMLQPAELAYALPHAGAVAVIAEATLVGRIPEPDTLPKLRLRVAYGAEAAGWLPFAALLEQGDDHYESPAADPAAPASIGYTSGTTGRPKGAVQSHRAVASNIALTATMHVKSAQDVLVTALPFPHVYGNVSINGALLAGMTAVILPRFETEAAAAAIARHRATLFEGVPTMYYYLLNDRAAERHDFSSLTRCTVGGQTMPIDKMKEVEAVFGCPLIELWGMTELAGLGTTFPALGERRLGSIGLPLPSVQCRIADLDRPGQLAPTGEPGELQIRGPVVMSGYLDDPAATAEAIDAEGWLGSGDIALQDAEGYIFVVDRRKDMINCAGYKVFPAEVERVLSSHPGVAMVGVAGAPDPLKGEVPLAFVVARQGASLDKDELLALCRAELSAYKCPREILLVDDLPKTGSGKILRRELRRQLAG